MTKFVLDMQGGKKGLLVNSRDICVQPGSSQRKAAGPQRPNPDVAATYADLLREAHKNQNS